MLVRKRCARCFGTGKHTMTVEVRTGHDVRIINRIRMERRSSKIPFKSFKIKRNCKNN